MPTNGGLWAASLSSMPGQVISYIPAVSPEAEAFSKDLKQHGFVFVSPTTIYAHMKAGGVGYAFSVEPRISR